MKMPRFKLMIEKILTGSKWTQPRFTNGLTAFSGLAAWNTYSDSVSLDSKDLI